MGPHRVYNEPRNHKRVNSFVFAAHYNKKRGRCCVVVGRLCQSVAGRGLVSGSRRNEVPKGGWSEAELWRSLPTTQRHLWNARNRPFGVGFFVVI